MIPINDYRQFIAELVTVAANNSGVAVDHIRLAVTESQLINYLKDLDGVVVAGDIPGSEFSFPAGYWSSTNDCLLMVLQKMPRDEQGTSNENDRYARLQDLMLAIVNILTDLEGDFDQFCDAAEMDISRPLVVEWEYNTYGGFNGLSLTWRMRDKT